MWSVVTLLGFLGLTAVVIVLGASSTARYEQERGESPQRTDLGDHEHLAAA